MVKNHWSWVKLVMPIEHPSVKISVINSTILYFGGKIWYNLTRILAPKYELNNFMYYSKYNVTNRGKESLILGQVGDANWASIRKNGRYQ